MNRAELLAFHDVCTKKMKSICQAKNADYAGRKDDNPFANFTRVESMGIATTVQGFLTRMTDKLSRLATFADGGKLQVADEGAEDTLLDLANYCILLAGYLRSAPAAKKDLGCVTPSLTNGQVFSVGGFRFKVLTTCVVQEAGEPLSLHMTVEPVRNDADANKGKVK